MFEAFFCYWMWIFKALRFHFDMFRIVWIIHYLSHTTFPWQTLEEKSNVNIHFKVSEDEWGILLIKYARVKCTHFFHDREENSKDILIYFWKFHKHHSTSHVSLILHNSVSQSPWIQIQIVHRSIQNWNFHIIHSHKLAIELESTFFGADKDIRVVCNVFDMIWPVTKFQ